MPDAHVPRIWSIPVLHTRYILNVLPFIYSYISQYTRHRWTWRESQILLQYNILYCRLYRKNHALLYLTATRIKTAKYYRGGRKYASLVWYLRYFHKYSTIISVCQAPSYETSLTSLAPVSTKLAYLPMLYELPCTVAQGSSKLNGMLNKSTLAKTRLAMCNLSRMIRFVYLTQWYSYCDEISEMYWMKWIFRPPR